MNNQTNLDQLILLVLSLSIPEQARLCDALLDSLESFEPDLDDATRDGEHTLAVIEQALAELPTNTKLHAFVEHVEAKLAAGGGEGVASPARPPKSALPKPAARI